MTGGADLSSLEKGLAILRDLAAGDGGLTAGQLSKSTGLNRTTVYRLCDALERGGWVRRGADGSDGTTRFELGIATHGLSVLVTSKYDTAARIQPVIAELSKALTETVHVGVLSRAEVIHIARSLPASGMSVAAHVGSREHAHCASLGKALLAALPDEALDEIYPEERLVTRTPHTLATRTALRQDLLKVRSRGYALDDEEGQLGIKCVGVPVFTSGGQALFALSVTSVPARMGEADLPRVVAAVCGSAALLTAAFGGTPPPHWTA